MADLLDGWLIQKNDWDGFVTLFHQDTQEKIVQFNPADKGATVKAQAVIRASDRLTDEQKSLAHFWSGYFYAHAQNETWDQSSEHRLWR